MAKCAEFLFGLNEYAKLPRAKVEFNSGADPVEEGRVPPRLGVEDGQVADGDAVLVEPMLEAPQPERVRTDQPRRLRRLIDLDVRAAQLAARRMPLPRRASQCARSVA